MEFAGTSRGLWKRLRSVVPWRWILFWFLLPNIVILAMWPIGGPGMYYQLLLFGICALVVAQLPWAGVKRLALLAMMLLMTTYYVCLSFNLPVWGFMHLPQFVSEVKPWRAPIYLIGTLIFLGILVVVLRFAPRVPGFVSFVPMAIALGTVQLVSLADARVSAPTDLSYHVAPEAGDPFHPASEVTGLNHPQELEGRNVMIVLVEALGTPAGDVERQLFADSWDFSNVEGRYAISTGNIPYYGSTTTAEVRELCGAWGNYTDFDFESATCLPQAYGALGYRTSAVHSFTSNLFQRAEWYPRLKFDRIEFAPDLYRDGIDKCGGLFPGACDREIPSLIAKRLKAAQQPQFIYWLTLNSHLPVLADDSMGTGECELGPEDWQRENMDICRVFMIHDQLARSLRALAADPELPPTDFLIVGDHIPPFFDRESRMRFNGRTVPWIYLHSKKPAAPGRLAKRLASSAGAGSG